MSISQSLEFSCYKHKSSVLGKYVRVTSGTFHCITLGSVAELFYGSYAVGYQGDICTADNGKV